MTPRAAALAAFVATSRQLAPAYKAGATRRAIDVLADSIDGLAGHVKAAACLDYATQRAVAFLVLEALTLDVGGES